MVYMPHWPVPLGLKEVDLGLERVRNLLKQLNNPHLRIKNIIHIAGTNGKGSTHAFLKYILWEAGYSVNAYTSPHLIEFNERIQLNGQNISDEILFELCEEVRIAAEKTNISPTFFEGSTVIALLAFARYNADFLILETGMGGRLDATNIFEHPLATIITTIGMDHTEFLGNTIEKIAFEKAGIIKKSRPCIISAQEESAEKVLMTIADNVDAPICAFGYDWTVEENKFFSVMGDIDNIYLGLAGKHQYINMGNAVATIKFLELGINESMIRSGLLKTKWPARIEKLTTGLLADENYPIWVDGAHNLLGSHVVSIWLDDVNDGSPLYLIVGITKGRNVKDFMSSFSPNKISLVCGVKVNYEPKSYNGEFIALECAESGFNSKGFEYVEEAIHYIKQNMPPGKIIIIGSLFLAGEALNKNNSIAKLV